MDRVGELNTDAYNHIFDNRGSRDRLHMHKLGGSLQLGRTAGQHEEDPTSK